MKKYLDIFIRFRKIYIMSQLEYRGNFLFWSFIALMWTGFNFFFTNVIATANNGIAGWTPLEIQLLISVYTIIDSFTWSVFYNNMSRYTQRVFSGELNYLLTKPISTQFMLMTERSDLSNIPRFFIGVVMTVVSVKQLELAITPFLVLAFIAMIITSLTCIYFSWFIISTLSFYVEKLNNINEIFPTMRRFLETPADVYTRLPLMILSFTVPFALLTSIPANVLRTGATPVYLLLYIVIAILLAISSRIFFKLSVKKYSGVAN